MKTRCLSTYEPLASGTWTPRARQELFDGARVSKTLGFRRQDFFDIKQEQNQRMSISGVQDKLVLRLVDGHLEPVDSGGTYILKPIPSTPMRQVGELPANEHLTMQLARQVWGIHTAPNTLVFMSDGELAYLTRRFDRTSEGDKIHQEDFCQLLGAPDKYESSYQAIAGGISTYSSIKLIDLDRFFRRLCLNYLLANGDAHLKNFSMYQRGRDRTLTPAYDLVCSKLHLPNESRFALDLYDDEDLDIADEDTHGYATGRTLLEFAIRIGIKPKRARKVLALFQSEKHECMALGLIEHSFLSPKAKDNYVTIFEDRLSALRIV